MPSASARPRLSRLVLPPLADGRQVLFVFDQDFPESQRRPTAEYVLAARRPEKKSTISVPAGIHVHLRKRADDAWQPIKPLRGRGRPAKAPAGTWDDDDNLLPEVAAIVGDRDSRADDGAEKLDALCRLARRFLGQSLADPQRRRLRALLFGRQRTTGARTDVKDPNYTHRTIEAKPSVIVRQLLAWRHGVTDPDVRRMHPGDNGRPRVKMIYR